MSSSVVNPHANPVMNPALDPAASAGDLKLTDAVMYRQPAFKGGRYRYVSAAAERVTALAFNLNGTVEYPFILPGSNVTNLGMSEFAIDITIPAQGATSLSYVNNGFLPELSYIELQTLNRKVKIVNLQNIPQYTKTTWAATISYDQYMHMPQHTVDAATMNAVLSPGNKFHRVQTLTIANATAATNVYGGFEIPEDGKVVAAVANDPVFGISNAIGADALNQALNYKIRMRLGMLPHTLFSLYKDIYWGQDLRLVFGFNQAKKFGGTGTGGDAATAAAAALVNDLTVLPTVDAANPPQFYMAVQEDLILQQAAISAFHSGLKLRVPTVEGYVENLGVAGLKKVARKISRNEGANLLRVYTTVGSAVDNGLQYCNINNTGSIKWTDIWTKLDNQYLQDSKLSFADFTPYMFLRDRLEDSVYRSPLDYLRRCFWVDDFTGIKKSIDWCKHDMSPAGIPLTKDFLHVVELTTAVDAENIFQFYIIQRDLVISENTGSNGGGIMLL